MIQDHWLASWVSGPNNVGLGYKLPRNPTASWWSDQVLQYSHIYRCSSCPISVKGNCGTLLWIRAAVNLSKCHLHFRSFRETSVNLNHSFDLFWVMDAFGNLMKATVDGVQKLYPDSCLCVRIPKVVLWGQIRRPIQCLLVLNTILIACANGYHAFQDK